MFAIEPRPLLLRIALVAMWAALVVLIVLQFRWSAELGAAYEQRLTTSLAASADNFRASFQSDLSSLCRAVQNAPTTPPPSPLPYQLYTTDAMLETAQRFNPDTNRWDPVPWPSAWAGLREEMNSSAEDLALASSRRWFNRPWLASAAMPVLFRALSTAETIDEDPSLPRFQGFLVVVLDLPQMSSRYFPLANDRTFAASAIESRVRVTHLDTLVFDSNPDASAKASSAVQLDMLAGRSNLRPAGDASPWRLSAEHRPGSLDAAVSSLRIRNLATGLAVCLVLLAGIAFLILNARKAEQLSRLQTDFVAGFSHELRTPITAICMLSGNLRDGLPSEPDQVRHYGELILEQGNRLRTRIEDILGFAAGRDQRLHLQSVVLPELIEKVLLDEAPVLRGFEVSTRFDPDLAMALADPAALRSCLANLITNAAKYARRAAWLGIEVTDGPHGTLSITIADKGPGIDPADLDRVFEPFFRGRQARAGNIPGSGLGLHLVRTRITAMGGKISVHSVPGQGTAFTILLRSTS